GGDRAFPAHTSRHGPGADVVGALIVCQRGEPECRIGQIVDRHPRIPVRDGWEVAIREADGERGDDRHDRQDRNDTPARPLTGLSGFEQGAAAVTIARESWTSPRASGASPEGKHSGTLIRGSTATWGGP